MSLFEHLFNVLSLYFCYFSTYAVLILICTGIHHKGTTMVLDPIRVDFALLVIDPQ
jgi:hypothetical protein